LSQTLETFQVPFSWEDLANRLSFNLLFPKESPFPAKEVVFHGTLLGLTLNLLRERSFLPEEVVSRIVFVETET
jgi:hypothetical protein